MSKAHRLSALCGALLSFVTGWSRPATAGLNPNFCLPLHTEIGIQGCGPPAVDCLANRPIVNIPANTDVTIYLTVNNHNNLAGVQTAFEWDAAWVHIASIFDCAPGQLNAVVPAAPGGPTAGSVVTAFNCVTSGQLLIVGRMWMTSGPSGCLRQVQSTYPFGIHAVDCSQGIDEMSFSQDERAGKICVSVGGRDTCDGPPPAVQHTTWGQVKATYR